MLCNSPFEILDHPGSIHKVIVQGCMFKWRYHTYMYTIYVYYICIYIDIDRIGIYTYIYIHVYVCIYMYENWIVLNLCWSSRQLLGKETFWALALPRLWRWERSPGSVPQVWTSCWFGIYLMWENVILITGNNHLYTCVYIYMYIYIYLYIYMYIFSKYVYIYITGRSSEKTFYIDIYLHISFK